jgi:flagellar biosynthetic protein FliR
MDVSANALTAWISAFMLAFARIGAMLSVAPVFGSGLTPVRIRLVLGLLLTWIVQPFVQGAPTVEPFGLAGVIVLAQQVLIGLAMGLVLQIGFSALTVGGQVMANSMGLGFASVVDPQNGVQVPLLGEFYWLLGALLFFGFGGHLVVVELLAKSFHTLPVANSGMTGDTLWALVSWSGLMFDEGLRIALPVLSIVLLTNLAFGVATRAAPQLNIFSVGFSVTLLLGFVALLFSLGHLPPVFDGVLGSCFQVLEMLVRR